MNRTIKETQEEYAIVDMLEQLTLRLTTVKKSHVLRKLISKQSKVEHPDAVYAYEQMINFVKMVRP